MTGQLEDGAELLGVLGPELLGLFGDDIELLDACVGITEGRWH